MKRFLTILLALLLSVAMLSAQKNTSTAKVKPDKVKLKNGHMYITMVPEDNMDQMPYKAGYSSQFVIANPAHARIVQDVWKDWDDNMLDRHASHFADSIVMELPNGMLVRGKDSVLMMAKKHRGNYTTVKSEVEAWMSMRSTDRNEDWVLIWGIENRTTPDGKKEKVMLHEIWNINKDGKIAFMRRYTRKPERDQPALRPF